MKKTSQKITRFESGTFYVDIIEKRNKFEAYLVRKNKVEPMYMFGCSKTQYKYDSDSCDMIPYKIDFDYFCEMVEANLNDYKDLYHELNDDEKVRIVPA